MDRSSIFLDRSIFQNGQLSIFEIQCNFEFSQCEVVYWLLAAPLDVFLYAAEFFSESLELISRSNIIDDLNSTLAYRT